MTVSETFHPEGQTVHPGLLRLLDDFPIGADGIYSAPMPADTGEQALEKDLREKVAAAVYDDYMQSIASSHSVPVMDHEVDRFLESIPRGGLVLDIGGCWGWHWRRLATTRPDVGVVIIDFVRANLQHSRRVLGELIGKQVALMHADAVGMPFASGGVASGFDGVWTVQVFQHIPNFGRACSEACRVLRNGGRFANYSLHRTPVNRLLSRLAGKPLHLDGVVRNSYHLTRASDEQRDVARLVFGGAVKERFTECLFHPDLHLNASGREGSVLGRIDAKLGDFPSLGQWIARQRSFHVTKK